MQKPEYTVRLLVPAEQDLLEIVEYIALDSIRAALRVADRIEQRLSLLAEQPHLGKRVTMEELTSMGYRYIVVDNYLAFYTVEEKTVLVHRILHGARDYARVLLSGKAPLPNT